MYTKMSRLQRSSRLGVALASIASLVACKSTNPSSQASRFLSEDGNPVDPSTLKLYFYDGTVAQFMSDEPSSIQLTDPTPNSGRADIAQIGGLSQALGLPPMPRKTALHDIAFKNDTTIHLGIEGSVLGIVSYASVLNIALGMETNRQLSLAKHTPNNEALTYIDDQGKVQLKTDDEQPFVASCTYEAGAKQTMMWRNSLKVMGSGLSNETTSLEATKVSIVSEFISVKGHTVASLMNLCQEAYASRVKKEIKGELSRQILAKTQYAGDSEQIERIAIRAALWGPRTDRIKLYGHHWNFKTADVTSTGTGHVLVKGRIDHSINGQKDDWVDYTCEGQDAEEVKKDISFKQKSLIRDYKDEAGKVVDLICQDAYVQFRETKFSRVEGNIIEGEDRN